MSQSPDKVCVHCRQPIIWIAGGVNYWGHAVTKSSWCIEEGYHEPKGQEAYLEVSRALLESLVDSDNCWFDHHGGCQAHGYLSLSTGEVCPQAELKKLLGVVS